MLKDHIINELRSIVAPDRFLDTPAAMASYGFDAYIVEARPDAVMFPVSTDEVAGIMKIASREKIPVTARGAGTNLSGGSVPVCGGVVLCLTKMNQVIEVETADRYVVVQPGVVNGDLQKILAKKNFFYPPDPSSYSISTIGGNIAENAGGPSCLKYGVTADYVMGLQVVLASGRVIRLGSRNVKDVTGYRPSGIFCGAEGTLGIITEATLRVAPCPEAKRTLMIRYDDLDDTARTVSAVIAGGILPAAMELMDNITINLVEDAKHIGLPRDAEGLLLVEVTGINEAVEKEMQAIAAIARKNHASAVDVAGTQAESDRLWAARRSVYGVLTRLSPTTVVEDATVPVSRVPEMIRGCRQITEKYRLKMSIVGHAGDGNLHPTINTDIRDKEEWQRVEAASREIFQLAHDLGGCLTGEHGVGLAKAKFLSLVMSRDTIEFMSMMKKAFDPHNILNPGKFN